MKYKTNEIHICLKVNIVYVVSGEHFHSIYSVVFCY